MAFKRNYSNMSSTPVHGAVAAKARGQGEEARSPLRDGTITPPFPPHSSSIKRRRLTVTSPPKKNNGVDVNLKSSSQHHPDIRLSAEGAEAVKASKLTLEISVRISELSRALHDESHPLGGKNLQLYWYKYLLQLLSRLFTASMQKETLFLQADAIFQALTKAVTDRSGPLGTRTLYTFVSRTAILGILNGAAVLPPGQRTAEDCHAFGDLQALLCSDCLKKKVVELSCEHILRKEIQRGRRLLVCALMAPLRTRGKKKSTSKLHQTITKQLIETSLRVRRLMRS